MLRVKGKVYESFVFVHLRLGFTMRLKQHFKLTRIHPHTTFTFFSMNNKHIFYEIYAQVNTTESQYYSRANASR